MSEDKNGLEGIVGTDEPKGLPSVGQLIAEIAKSKPLNQAEYENSFNTLSAKSQQDYAHLSGLQDHYRHKGYWSYFLMAVMAAMVLFQSLLLGMVGAGIWTFKDYAWLLPALLVQNLAQIIGLAVFVVKSLFKDMKQ